MAELFAGIGGFRRGFEPLGVRYVYACENDLAARKTYAANYPIDHPYDGDIRSVDEAQIPPHDLLVAGFPCQPFSLAGVSKRNALRRSHGFADTRDGTLIFEVARVLAAHRPSAFLLENVPHLLSHGRGRVWQGVRQLLEDELGYTVTHAILDAASFVPQRRRRLFIVGLRDPASFAWDQVALPDPARGPRLRAILHAEDGSDPYEPRYLERDGRVRERYALSARAWASLQAHRARHAAQGHGFGYGLVGPDDVTRALLARYHKDGSEILVDRGPGRTPRRLTPRECARLMGFDGPGESHWQIPVSDTQAYRQFGNAVVPPVVTAIGQALCACLTDAV